MTKTKTVRQTLEERQDAEDIKEKLTVLGQPHRMGERGDMTDAFGTFLRGHFHRLEQDCMRRCWEAGQMYIRLVAKWRRAKGIPQRVSIDEAGTHGGGELGAETINGWSKKIEECDDAMKCFDASVFRAAQGLVLDDMPPPQNLHGDVKYVLTRLAVSLGLLTG